MTFILANGKNRGQRSSKLVLDKSHDNLHSFSYHLHLFGLKTHRRQHPSVYVLFSCFYNLSILGNASHGPQSRVTTFFTL